MLAVHDHLPALAPGSILVRSTLIESWTQFAVKTDEPDSNRRMVEQKPADAGMHLRPCGPPGGEGGGGAVIIVGRTA